MLPRPLCGLDELLVQTNVNSWIYRFALAPFNWSTIINVSDIFFRTLTFNISDDEAAGYSFQQELYIISHKHVEFKTRVPRSKVLMGVPIFRPRVRMT